MRNGFTAGLGIGLALLVCGGTGFIVYKAIGGASPATAQATSDTSAAKASVTASDAASGNKTVIGQADAKDYASAMSTLHTVRCQCELYRLQHLDRSPDMAAFPNWEPFTRKTDQNGMPGDHGQFGPYLSKPPVNPLNGFSRVAVVDREMTVGDSVKGEQIGFVFHNATGHWWATDKSGRRVLDETIQFKSPQAEANRGKSESAYDRAKRLSPQARMQAMCSQLENLRSQIELYRLTHNDQYPDFKKYRSWEQLTTKTGPDGQLNPSDSVSYASGPYFSEPPRNVLNGKADVLVVAREIQPGEKIDVKGYGWVLSGATGKLWATDQTEQRILDDAAAWNAPAMSLKSFAAPSPAASARASLQSTVMTMRSQMELYKLQHADQLPDFQRHPRWEQLTRMTDQAGNPVAQGGFGPYLQKAPVNPLNGKMEVELIDRDPILGQKATGPNAGYIVNSRTGKLWGVDEKGVVILDY